jgi:hypothetical protein
MKFSFLVQFASAIVTGLNGSFLKVICQLKNFFLQRHQGGFNLKSGGTRVSAATEFIGNFGNIHAAVGTQTDMVPIHIGEFTGPVFYFVNQRGNLNILDATGIIDQTIYILGACSG